MKLQINRETQVGIFIASGFVLTLALLALIGVQNPFSPNIRFKVNYNFAGGIEVGSPVRVSGIKVGKVEAIDFLPAENVPVQLTVAVKKKAAVAVRENSKFYINLAGIIGERYLEITPGDPKQNAVYEGQTFEGVTPPRIDQIFSQSFDLAGKILELVEENEGDIGKSIELLYKLSENVNKTVVAIDKSKMFNTNIGKLINNMITLSTELRKASDEIKTPEGQKTLKLLHDLLWRLEPLDKSAIRKFLQDEGIRTKIF